MEKSKSNTKASKSNTNIETISKSNTKLKALESSPSSSIVIAPQKKVKVKIFKDINNPKQVEITLKEIIVEMII